ncbi:Molybdenum cofactor sulfurase [Apostasia shenzhenica]|uniref:Molybdenum cofactor sulfurase n=1 Tax=Apostasia shenzhenica TaxID=1088818 RepID=A0A2I0B2N1_9ASPA|nr:Molybdenum cofactor sulfurase [Apostasia shenzhenica]
MFSKLAAFRRKASSAQKGKQNDHERCTSDIKGNPSKDVCYFSVKSIPTLESVPGNLVSKPTILSDGGPSVSSPFSDGHSSLESNNSFSTHVHQERISTSSGQSAGIVNGTPFWISYEDAEEQFLDDHEGYFLHLLADNVLEDQYPMLHKIIYLDNVTCPPFSRFQLRKGSCILISPDLHSSVKHVLQAASQSNIKVRQIPLKKEDLTINGIEMHKLLRNERWSGQGSGLLLYTAQSFSTGICHSTSWITSAQQQGWKVVLDVSSSLPTVCVDLSLYQPEFVLGSLNHMLGYPSPLSFLLIRRSSYSIFHKMRSIDLQLVEHPETRKAVHVVMEGENLTMHNFAAFRFGFEHLNSIGIVAIQRRVESLMSWLIKTLKSLTHKLDEKPLIQFYGSLDLKNRGSILPFNVLDPTGNVFPAKPVQQLAERSNIVLGSCSLIDAKISHLLHLKSNRQMEDLNLHSSLCNLHCLRLSFGAVSTFSNAYRLVEFLSWFRDDKFMSQIAAGYAEERAHEF